MVAILIVTILMSAIYIKQTKSKLSYYNYNNNNYRIDSENINTDLIQVVTKQTLLASIDFIGVAAFTIIFLLDHYNQHFQDFTCAVYLFWAAVFLQHILTPVTIWLSFVFANKQYQCLFGKCDKYCFTCCFQCTHNNCKKNN